MDYTHVQSRIIVAILTGIWTMKKGAPLTVISGCAPGADSVAWEWGRRMEKAHHNVELQLFPADWKKHGRRAGYIRNAQMLEEGKPTVVLAFSSDLSESKGTSMMVDLAKKAGVQTFIIGD